ncbi:MAG: rRNA maturation RNase YbeY [Verrucomicrobiota bacterium]
MSLELTIRSRQHVRALNRRLLRQIIEAVLTEYLQLEQVELGVTLVGAAEMARVNWQFLQHEGSTDVITFDHTEAQASRKSAAAARREICGELYVCVDDAVMQARSFRTTWQSEIVRYIVHGILHLCGHDDHRAAARRVMKCEENRLVRRLKKGFAFRSLAKSKAR